MRWVDTDELFRYIDELREGGGVVVIVDCSKIESRTSLDAAMRRSIPLDPRIEEAVPSWDSIQDSIFGGFAQMAVQRAILVFARALPILALSDQVREMLDDTLATVASQLAAPRPHGAALTLEILFERTV